MLIEREYTGDRQSGRIEDEKMERGVGGVKGVD